MNDTTIIAFAVVLKTSQAPTTTSSIIPARGWKKDPKKQKPINAVSTNNPATQHCPTEKIELQPTEDWNGER